MQWSTATSAQEQKINQLIPWAVILSHPIPAVATVPYRAEAKPGGWAASASKLVDFVQSPTRLAGTSSRLPAPRGNMSSGLDFFAQTMQRREGGCGRKCGRAGGVS